MDEQQKNQAVNIKVKTAENTDDIQPEPTVDETLAPPEQEVIIEEKDADAVNTAVQDISDAPVSVPAPTETPVYSDTTIETTETPGTTENSMTDDGVAVEPEVKEAPVPTEESEPETEQKSVSNPDPFIQNYDTAPIAATTSTTPQQSMSNNEQTLPHEHRNNKIFAVIITLIIALSLVGAAVYVYISAQNNTSETAKSQAIVRPQQQIAEVIPATTLDVEQTATEIDKTIKSIDDEADLSETAISDTTLGL